jgi:hypothetical protein
MLIVTSVTDRVEEQAVFAGSATALVTQSIDDIDEHLVKANQKKA